MMNKIYYTRLYSLISTDKCTQCTSTLPPLPPFTHTSFSAQYVSTLQQSQEKKLSQKYSITVTVHVHYWLVVLNKNLSPARTRAALTNTGGF